MLESALRMVRDDEYYTLHDLLLLLFKLRLAYSRGTSIQ